MQQKVNRSTAEQAKAISGMAIAAELEAIMQAPLTEQSYAEHVMRWNAAPAAHVRELQLAGEYAAWAALSAEGQARHHDGILFKLPKKLDVQHLVPVDQVTIHGVSQFAYGEKHLRHREGFHLTDAGTDLAGALDQASYCIKCHHQAKDSCSKGLREKTGEPKTTAFGVPLVGCPLEEKISEMNEVKGQGNPIGALAIVTIDNPMVRGGRASDLHDCMKSCIYQKQEPVDIPQVETRSLKDVLELPWGFEIYSLLTRWNPLNIERPVPHAATGRKVLVVGLGPAGFTLSHHLMNDGHTRGGDRRPEDRAAAGGDCQGVDVRPDGAAPEFRPVRDIVRRVVREPRTRRVMAGFGGVAEYGITVRWNKNFLKIIRLLLERRSRVQRCTAGVRFGGTMTVEDAFRAWASTTSRCALGAGPADGDSDEERAGARRAPGFRFPDGAAAHRSRQEAARWRTCRCGMPIVVIGGGLTAIDTATESLAYYVVQVEKFLRAV